MLEYPKFLAYFICVLYIKIHSSFECWHYYDDIIQSTNFDIATFRFRNFSMFFYGIGIGFEKNWYRKKYRYRFRKNFGIGKSFGIGFEKIWYRKKYRYWYRKNFGIEKSIGIGIGKKLVSKKVSVSVSKKIGIGKKYRYRSDFGFRHTLWASNLSWNHNVGSWWAYLSSVHFIQINCNTEIPVKTQIHTNQIPHLLKDTQK